MNGVICQAIQEKRILTFEYDGYPRIVEPHAHGVTSKGNEALRCYQTAGGSKVWNCAWVASYDRRKND